MFGRLTINDLQHDTVATIGNSIMAVTTMFVLAAMCYFRLWKPLWKNWLTSLDPKRIGVMYFVVGTVMLFKGVIEACMMRVQQMLSVGDCHGFLSSEHFQQVFSAHGTAMIFFVAMAYMF